MEKLTRKEVSIIGCEASKLSRKNKQLKIVENYNLNPNLCNNCKLKLIYEKRHNKFCSSSCSAVKNNSIIRKYIVCRNCSKKLIKYQEQYCSKDCKSFHKKQIQIEEYLNDSKSKSHDWIKGYLISIRGNKCEYCNWAEINPITGRVPIEMDHINGDNTDNRIENLRILCPNCHSLTPTFRSLNKVNVARRNSINNE